MNPGYTISEIENIRKLVHENNEPADSSLLEFIQHDLNETKNLIRRNLNILRDLSVSDSKICSIFNDPSTPSPRRSPRLAPKPVDINIKKENIPPAPLSATALSLPPKCRGKSMPKTPNGRISSSPFTDSNANGKSNSNINGKLSTVPKRPSSKIRILPKWDSSPAAIAHHKHESNGPEISSLAAVLHQYLGPANVCRVLASCELNKTPYYLVSFFQPDNSPCFVPSENLFQLKSNIGFPLGNEEEFRKEMQENEISVDFLLERIFSSAQNLVINHAEVLFPQDELKKVSFSPEPQQLQQIMFQCVSCAAFLLVCYVCCQYEIPHNKLQNILLTIMKTNPPKFASTQTIMNSIIDTNSPQFSGTLMELLSLIENK